MSASSVEISLSCWNLLISMADPHLESVGKENSIPILSSDIVESICDRAIELLKERPILPHICVPVLIVGDLHGSLLDLIRVFIKHGTPDKTRFLFLGDYVDRGNFSLEVILILLTFFINYPENITLLRGNHEFEAVNKEYGFLTEILSVYEDEKIFKKFNEVFSYLPLAAVVGDDMFCVHGGIGPTLKALSQIEELERPITTENNTILKDMVWADPTDATPLFFNSYRGDTSNYGKLAVRYFFNNTGMNWIIRAHECVQHGIKRHSIGNVVTVFTSSCYNATTNESGVLYVKEDKQFVQDIFPPIPKTLTRKNATFYKHQLPPNRRYSLSLGEGLGLKPSESMAFISARSGRGGNLTKIRSVVIPKCQLTRKNTLYKRGSFDFSRSSIPLTESSLPSKIAKII